MKDLCRIPVNIKRLLLILRDVDAVGVDIKFEKPATVFVLGPDDFDKEELYQRLARGSRSLTNVKGRLFTTGNLSDGIRVKKQIESQKGFNFAQGAQIIDFVLRRIDRDDVRTALKVAIKTLDKSPFQDY